MDKNAKIYVAGHRGLVGSALVRNLRAQGLHATCSTRTHAELDLTDQAAVEAFFAAEKPDYVFLAAAKVGGIHANNTYPAEFIRDNLAIQTNIIHAAYQNSVKRLLFLGSSCIYPKLAPQPMKEEHLLTGPLEPTNRPYALAKIAGIEMCWSYNRQYGTQYLAVMPTNLYGPGDNYDLENSHVMPALIRRFHEAKLASAPSVTVWGTGTPQARIPLQRRHGRCLRVPDEPAGRRIRPAALAAGPQRLAWRRCEHRRRPRPQHPRTGRDREGRGGLSGQARIRRQQARRHAAQADGRGAAECDGLEGTHGNARRLGAGVSGFHGGKHALMSLRFKSVGGRRSPRRTAQTLR